MIKKTPAATKKKRVSSVLISIVVIGIILMIMAFFFFRNKNNKTTCPPTQTCPECPPSTTTTCPECPTCPVCTVCPECPEVQPPCIPCPSPTEPSATSSTILRHFWPLNGSDSATLLLNPERGFRTESVTEVKKNGKILNYQERVLSDADIAAPFKLRLLNTPVTVCQQYIYLTDYINDRQIDNVGLQGIERVFRIAKECGVKLLLRIVYFKVTYSSTQINLTNIRSHITQLQKYLSSSLVYALQFGFLGVWGENQHLHTNDEIKSVGAHLLTTVTNKKVTCRQYRYRVTIHNAVASDYTATRRLGYNNDFYAMETLQVDSDFSPSGPEYLELRQLGPTTVYDVEMPYTGNDALWHLNKVPINFAYGTWIRMSDCCCSTFSIVHNVDVCLAELKKTDIISLPGLSKDPLYFMRDNDSVTPYQSRTAFDFLRDHFGYNLRLMQVWHYKETNLPMFELLFKNYGFAAPMNPRKCQLYLENESKLYNLAVSDHNLENWLPNVETGYTIVCRPNAAQVIATGKYLLKLWIPDLDVGLQNVHVNYDLKLFNKIETEVSATKYVHVLGEFSL